MTIELSQSEFTMFSLGGFLRNTSAIIKGMQLEPGRKDMAFDNHTMGAISEAAWAKAVNCFYCPLIGKPDTETGDVFGKFQIKSTLRPDFGLFVRPHDPAHFPYIHTLIKINPTPTCICSVTFPGYMIGHEAKQDLYWNTKLRTPAFEVPIAKLHPIKDLLPATNRDRATVTVTKP